MVSHKNKIMSALVAFLVVTLSACVTVEDPNALSRNKDPEKALEIYTKLGIKYLQKRNMEDASRTLNRAYDIDPDDPRVNNALALFYTAENEPTQVVKHYEAALKEDPGFSTARNNYAAFLYEREEYGKALEQLKVAVKDYTYTRRFQSFENMGLCYLRLDQPEEAEKAFQRALQLNPRMPKSLMELADLRFQKGDYRTASFYLKQLDSLGIKATARQLWLEIQISRALGNRNRLASLELALKNLFPNSAEYKKYLESKSEYEQRATQ